MSAALIGRCGCRVLTFVGFSDTQFPVETLKAYFSEFAIPEPGKEDTLGSIGLVEFKTIAGLLNLDHTEEEIEKIFRVVYTENKTRRDSQIDFHDYIKVCAAFLIA